VQCGRAPFLYCDLALPLLLNWGSAFEDTRLSVLQCLEGVGFRVALIDDFKHSYHALAMSGKQLQIIKHIVTLSHRKKSQLVNVLLVTVVSHFPVVLAEPKSLKKPL